jgi:uncharacterized protein with von Willebrand factor type A (vWA) domain
MEYVTHTFGGGTSTLIGMTEALRLMQDQPEFKTADVVLVGDGQDYFQEGDRQVRDALHKLGVRIHAISIACPNNAYMQQMADHVIDVTDIANDAVSILAEQIT